MLDVDVAVDNVDYRRYSNRQLLGIPFAVLAIALVVIGVWYATTGVPVEPGIEFTGGVEIQVEAPGGQAAIQDAFTAEISSIRPIRTAQDTYIVTFQSTALEGVDTETLTQQAEQAGFTVESIQSTSPSFGEATQRLALLGVGIAFVGMSIIIFILFRTFIPSIAVVLSAFSDIVVPVALMNLLGIQLSLGTVAALLMLIGYSVDSDVLLTNQIIRRSGGFYPSTYRAMRTGVTMTLTSLSAVTVMAIVATLFGIDLLASIGTVLAFGLLTDLMNTYMMNVSLLRWYVGVDD
ncbi:MAG: protein translocase subunit SecF [Halobacteriales archaeon]|nr:protein translocase subunit SecF [Halobacteriales archaeon]